MKDNVPRISCLEVSKEEFIERFERPNFPTVITDCQNGWDAHRKWTIEVNVTVMEYEEKSLPLISVALLSYW